MSLASNGVLLMKDYEIHPFDVSKASRDEWSRFHRFRRMRNAEVFPGDSVEEDSTYEEWAVFMHTDNVVTSYYAMSKKQPDEIVGWLQMSFAKETSPSYKGNEYSLNVRSLGVLKDHRRNGIGTGFLKIVHDFAVENHKRTIIGYTIEPEGRTVGQLIGGKEALDMRVYRLNMDSVDWNMISKWISDGRKRSPDATLEFYEKIPEEILGAYCRKYTEFYNQMPLEDLDVGAIVLTPESRKQHEESYAKTGEIWLTGIIREKNGDISGLTDIVYDPSETTIVKQALTGIDPSYRGSGKGKWIKAAMLERIREEFPDVRIISSTIANTNDAMLSINERMGFTPHREVYYIQIETENLGLYLQGR